MEEKKTREMTVEEKEKFLSRVRIETEDIPESQSREDVFKASIQSYNDSMQEQIIRLKSAISLNEYMRQTVLKLLETSNDLPDSINEEVLKTEISTRDSILAKMIESKLLMEKRLQLSDKVCQFCIAHYDELIDLDIYFGGVIGLPETRQLTENILENVDKHIN